jgi:thiol-disulfide isomerase/thioredoxin/mono/diheme cytochrome c family protein
MSKYLALLLAIPLALSFALVHGGPKQEARPRVVRNFSLKDPRDNKTVSLAGLKDRKAVVVVFLGTQCPINNAFLPELARLNKQYAPRGVRFVGINANEQDSAAEVADHARKNEVPFPMLKDDGKVADLFGAERTPEAFLLEPSGKVLYHGRIDDQFGVGYYRPGKPTRRDLAAAMDEVLAGKPVSVPSTPVAGCRIARAARPKDGGPITYTRQVARILQKNCQDCHRPGQIGPFSLLKYEDAAAWAGTIREVIEDGRMPPWYADPRHGKFANERRLSNEDRAALLAWIDAGAPKGDVRDLPPPRKFSDDWVIGKPDVVLRMPRAFDVPAETPPGGVPYKHFVTPTNFKEDKWVVRAEARPDAVPVVHHMLIYILPPGQIYNPDDPGTTLCGTAPGEMPLILQEGQAKKVPAGSRLLFQMHYTPNGKAYRDQSSIGLIFAKEPPKHRILTKPIHNIKFILREDRIPAGAADYKIEGDFVFEKDGYLVAFMPHMHLRGKSFRYEALYPDGKSEVLLFVPRYNFNWQSVYRLREPKAVPKGTTIHCVAHFDNSDKNPHNPDPKTDVYWGDQTWQEMMVGWMDYFYTDEKK